MSNKEDIKFIDYEGLRIFYKIKNIETYPPNEDSFLLASCVKKFSGKNVLDLGCGSGIQGLVSFKKCRRVILADIDKNALILSKINFIYNYRERKNPLEILYDLDKYSFSNVDFVQTNLFDNINEQFDLIIFNPPYLPAVDKEDPRVSQWVAGGGSGCEIILRFLDDVHNYVNKGGTVLFVFSSLSNEKQVFNKLDDFDYEILIQRKYFFETLYVVQIKF